MNKEIFNKKILIAPLDWGLGHATRCIVIIKTLEKLGCDITVAASGKIKVLLQSEFPNLTFLDLPGYGISYSRSKRFFPFKILSQIPKIVKIMRFENKWLDDILQTQKFIALISDNRYGLYSKKIRSVLITHQLQIKTNSLSIDKMLQRYNYRFINCFNECWVPDYEGNFNIAGQLSHPALLPATSVKYIGPLSRFSKTGTEKPGFKWAAIISGPEPQRSLFEKKIFEAASKSVDKFLIVRGLPGETRNEFHLPNCEVFNHLNTEDMNAALNAGEFIISRCGYTTVMEILSLGKKSVLIPTPGQTEQEYLACHLSEQKWCYSFNQEDDFASRLTNAKEFKYALPQIDINLYKTILADFIASL